MADEGPWTRYQQEAAPADAPWTKYQAKPAAEDPSALSRLWQGMLGQDVSRVGRVGMGMADPVVGAAQGAAHLGPSLGIPFGLMRPSAGAAAEKLQQAAIPEADKFVRERETGYQQREKAAGLSGGLASEWARLLGNVASPVNVALGGAGAAAAPARAAGRIGMASGLGAVSGALEPTTDKDFATGKLKQAAGGAVGGAVGGTAGEAIGSLLGNAIAGNNSAAVDRYLTGRFKQTIRPGRMPGAAVGAPQLNQQDNRILTAVDQIIANKNNFRLTNEAGDLLPAGALPRSISQFSDALDQLKRVIFRAYDARAQATGQAGIQIDLTPAARMLQQIAANPVNRSTAPAVAADAQRIANNLLRDGTYSPGQVQEALINLNQLIERDRRATGFSHIKPVVDSLRADLDQAITTYTGPGYQILKNQYGALRSIEKDIANAAQREANKKPWGHNVATFFATEEAMRALGTGDLKGLASSAAILGAREFMRYLNNPNRAIAKLFQQRANPPGALRSAAGGALQELTMPLGIGGGIEGARATQSPSSFTTMEYPWMPAAR